LWIEHGWAFDRGGGAILLLLRWHGSMKVRPWFWVLIGGVDGDAMSDCDGLGNMATGLWWWFCDELMKWWCFVARVEAALGEE
jgi:hypothetical protein